MRTPVICLVRQALCAFACALMAAGAHAVSSSVTVNDIRYAVKDLVPGDGIAPAVVLDPTFEYFSAMQERDVLNQMDFDFIALRCSDCPAVNGTVDFYADDRFNLAARTLAPGSLYLDRRMIVNLVGITPGTQVTVTVDVSFNEGLTAPIGNASLDLAVAGYSLFPDDHTSTVEHEHASSGEPRNATVELSYTNTGTVLAPLHFAYIMGVFGTSPIPEPETAWLIAAGLGFLAWRARRHARMR
jgi:hypothetical protein